MSDITPDSGATAEPPATTPQPAPVTTAPVPAPYAAPVPAAPGGTLALVALIAGIVAAASAIIPGLSFTTFVPAFIAIGLGIAALVKKSPRAGRAKAAIILGGIAFIVAVVVSIATIGLAASNGFSSQEKPPAASSEADDSEPAIEEEEEVVEEPVVEAVPEDVVYSGKGDSILKIVLPDGLDQAAVATLTHKGKSNFAVWSLDDAMAQQDLMVNEIGNYSGTVAFNLNSFGISALEITADGPWTVTLKSIQKLRSFSAEPITGKGDDVFIYTGDAGAATISHKGSSNFAIWTYGDSSDLVVNEIGTYSGTVRWSGTSLVVLTADGTWSIKVD